jgi:hypothetical protein
MIKEITKTILICLPIEEMMFPIYKKYKCMNCGTVVGCTKETIEAIGKRKFEALCYHCAEGNLQGKIVLKQPSKNEIKRVERTIGRKLAKKEIKETMKELKESIEAPNYIG